MKKKTISKTEKSRKVAAVAAPADYQDTSFVLLKNSTPVAPVVPKKAKMGTGRELAKVLQKFPLDAKEAAAWNRDLKAARKTIRPPD